MAACSAREVDRAMQVLGYIEEPVALDVYDAGYEWVRHMLLEAWVETRAEDRWKMGPYVDLLTSMKLRTGRGHPDSGSPGWPAVTPRCPGRAFTC